MPEPKAPKESQERPVALRARVMELRMGVLVRAETRALTVGNALQGAPLQAANG